MTAPDVLTVGGARPLRGRLRIPGDKSISHRALMFAALAEGVSTITNLATGADVAATARVLGQLGVDVVVDAGRAVVNGSGFTEADDVLDCENSGTTMRVLAGVLAGHPFLSVLTGDGSLRSRPMGRIVEPLRAMGADVDGRDGATRAPLTIRGAALRGLQYRLPVASAQVKSAILLAGMHASGSTEVVSPGVSRDHTERMLAALGVPVTVDGLSVTITPGSEIVLEGVSCNPTRVGFVTVMKRMGADIELVATGEVCGEPVGELRVRSSELHGTTIEGAEIPNVIDEIPALAVAAAFADGVTDVRDAAELVVKESNRIGTLHQELGKLGVGVEARADGLSIRGGRAEPAAFSSHGDHRIAMAMAVAANAMGADSTVDDWLAVSSSYPQFARDLELLTR